MLTSLDQCATACIMEQDLFMEIKIELEVESMQYKQWQSGLSGCAHVHQRLQCAGRKVFAQRGYSSLVL